MANYSNLAATINAQIKANGNQEITGPVLNAVLTAMVTVLGDGYRLQGVAAPADNPGSPDNRVAYLASQDGTYTNFGGLVVSGEVALLLWDAVWTKATLVSIDTAVTPGSDNLVTSDAVNSAISALATQYMALVPAATEGNLAEFDNAGQVRDAGLATSDLATKDGHYPDLFAGFAGNLVDTRSAGTRQSFAFRQSGGDGVNYMRKILGRTEAWNQLTTFAFSATTVDGVTFTPDADNNCIELSGVLANHTYAGVTGIMSTNFVVGHNYFFYAQILANPNNLSFGISALNQGWSNTPNTPFVAAAISTNRTIGISSATIGNDFTGVKIRVIVVDLTLEGLGLTTADQFRALHPLGYYSPASKLINNAATGLETTGFNQWDEEAEEGAIDGPTGQKIVAPTRIRTKNNIPVLPSTAYYLHIPGQTAASTVAFFDAAGNFLESAYPQANTTFTTPANAASMLVGFLTAYGNTYNHDICINLSDASRNGTYEPYWKREIVLGLDNLACHDENNNAVVVNGLDGVGTDYDEAVVENGYVTKIIKRRARVNLGDLSWTLAPAEYRVYTTSIIDGKVFSGSAVATLMCPKYTPAAVLSLITGTQYQGTIGKSTSLSINDSALYNLSTPEQVAAALDGVYLDYPLATPKVLTLDNPIPALIEVDSLGTEKRLPEDTADNPQAPFECDSNYSVSTANLVRLLNL